MAINSETEVQKRDRIHNEVKAVGGWQAWLAPKDAQFKAYMHQQGIDIGRKETFPIPLEFRIEDHWKVITNVVVSGIRAGCEAISDQGNSEEQLEIARIATRVLFFRAQVAKDLCLEQETLAVLAQYRRVSKMIEARDITGLRSAVERLTQLYQQRGQVAEEKPWWKR